MWQKKAQKTDFFHFFIYIFHCHDDGFKPVPFTSSEPVDNKPPTQAGTQTSQESASTSKWSRSNQASVKNIDFHGGCQAGGY